MTYHAAYYHGDNPKWIVAQVLDFPGAISQGRTLNSARRMIRDALREMAEWTLELGEPLPRPNVRAKDKKAFLVEPVNVEALL